MQGGLQLKPSASAQKSSGVGFYFDTVVTMTLYNADETLLSDVWALCAHYESLLSKTVEGSDVYRLNHAQGQTIVIDPDTWDILREARQIHDLTGGAFSITLEPLVEMWDFTHGTNKMPTDAERIAALPLVDDTALVLGEGYTVTLPAGRSIDLGGIAKGYIADRVAALCRGRCTGATISLGGNTYVVGQKPDGSPWRVGIQDPDAATGQPLLVVSLREATIVTSGVYERQFVKDGITYHHILDPKTGSSAISDLTSATIVCDNSMLADALATACIVMGSNKALALMKSQGLDAVLLTKDKQILTTDGFTEKYAMVGVR